ncbi:hypothetical protein MAPG_11882 [Magnaporthiopsis poae ATCC 64411]|uniref:Uncharacterized protein n=1 Tax=Magnaporthiopsis poae (strain ATCC 64411 / 73-15) TaxID=644358 RepID=A0A0C4EGE6_MAGP6|nr:hypothetical protein MAPG_11882 [Magnaporthiopsis poae ATCC 64411]
MQAGPQVPRSLPELSRERPRSSPSGYRRPQVDDECGDSLQSEPALASPPDMSARQRPQPSPAAREQHRSSSRTDDHVPTGPPPPRRIEPASIPDAVRRLQGRFRAPSDRSLYRPQLGLVRRDPSPLYNFRESSSRPVAGGSLDYPHTDAFYPPPPPGIPQPQFAPRRQSPLRRSVSFADKNGYANEENGYEDDADDEAEIYNRTGYQNYPVQGYSGPYYQYPMQGYSGPHYHFPMQEYFRPTVLDTVTERESSLPRRLRSRLRVQKPHYHHIPRDSELSSESSESAYTDDGARKRDTQMTADQAAEAIDSRTVGMAEEAEEQTRLRLGILRKEIEDKVRLEMAEEKVRLEMMEELRKDTKRQAAEARAKIEREVREEIEAERKAEAEAKDAEAKRDEELTRLAREKMQQVADEIIGLLRERIPQQPEMTRETESARLNIERRQWRADILAEGEAVGATKRKADEREATVRRPPESRPSDPRPTHSRSPSGTPPLADRTGGHRRGLSSIYNAVPWESDGRSPPRAPDPPSAHSYDDSDRDPTTAPSSRTSETAPGAEGNEQDAPGPGWTTGSVSSHWSERRYRQRQEEAFRREQRKRRGLRVMREELIDPLADIVTATLAGAEYRPRFYRHYHHPQDAPERRRAEPASSMGEPAAYGGYNDAGDALANETLAIDVRTSHINKTRGAASTRSDADNLGVAARAAPETAAAVTQDAAGAKRTGTLNDTVEELAKADRSDVPATVAEPETDEQVEGPSLPAGQETFDPAGKHGVATAAEVATEPLPSGSDMAGPETTGAAEAQVTERTAEETSQPAAQPEAQTQPCDSGGGWGYTWLGLAWLRRMAGAR